MAAGLSILTGMAVGIWHQSRWLLLLIPWLLLLRMALNAIDGMLAREHDMKTPLGGILNELNSTTGKGKFSSA
jgi:CDP-diacylglycerol--glycerol-3-phosphate 3-phosphatidyltransferase